MRKVFFVMLLLLFLPIVFGELQVLPASQSVDVVLNSERLVFFELRNGFAYDVFDINFSKADFVSIVTIDRLDANKSVNVTARIKTNKTFERQSFSSQVSFKYLDIVDVGSKTFEVNISSGGFVPQTINIKIGDKIQFNNVGGLEAIVLDQYNHRYFDNVVGVGQSVVVQGFNQIDDFTYNDANDFTKVGRVVVSNSSEQLISNPDLFKSVGFNILSSFAESDLDMDIIPSVNVTVEFDSFQEIQVRLSNVGSVKIHDVFLDVTDKKSWFSFSDNSFDLDQGQNRFITVKIKPVINNSNQTNKTYSIFVRAEGVNTGLVDRELAVFIPFDVSAINLGNLTREQLIEQIRALSNVLASLDLSDSCSEEKIVYVNSSVEFDKEDAIKNFRALNQNTESIKSFLEKNTKSCSDIFLQLEGLSNLADDLNDSIVKANELAEGSEQGFLTSTNNLLLLIIIFFFVIVLGYVIWRVRSVKKKRLSRADQG